MHGVAQDQQSLRLTYCRAVGTRSAMHGGMTPTTLTRTAFVVAMSAPTHAADDRDYNWKPEITAAAVSGDQKTLNVHGMNFGTRPWVALAHVELKNVRVDSSGQHLVVPIPPLTPGTYLLQV